MSDENLASNALMAALAAETPNGDGQIAESIRQFIDLSLKSAALGREFIESADDGEDRSDEEEASHFARHDQQWSVISQAQDRLVDAIVATPAQTARGIALKLAAWRFCLSFEATEWQQEYGAQFADSALADALRLASLDLPLPDRYVLDEGA